MDSQIVEVAIGLALTFFLVALIASSIVEIIAMLLKKRAKDLDTTLDKLLTSGNLNALKETSIYKTLSIGSGKGKTDGRMPSYIPSRAFADGIVEMLAKAKRGGTNPNQLLQFVNPGPLRDRLIAIVAEVGDDLTAVKARLESWFDDAMGRLQGAYKRWAKLFLFLFGLAIAVPLNVSATHIGIRLWNDAPVRTAVVNSASDIVADPNATATQKIESLDAVVDKINDLDDLGLPIGWELGPMSFWKWVILILGWVMTAALTMLGAEFWFELLKRLVAIRGGTGGATVRPAPADADPTSAISAMGRRERPTPEPDQNATAAQRLFDLIPDVGPA